MEYRHFGNTGLKVSALGFGAGHIGSPEMEEKAVECLLNQVLDLGINLIDTARSYGLSETRIGRYLSYRRSSVILSTKVGYTYRDKPDWSYDATLGTVEESLSVLKTDYLDIVHLHSCDKIFLEQGEAIAALEKARQQGKIRVIAYSGENEALSFAIGSGRFGSIQCSLNIFDQRGMNDQLPIAAAQGMGIIAKRPLANAVWRYRERPEGHGHAAYWDRMHQMDLKTEGLDLAELSMRFSAYNSGVSACIAGTLSIGHLKENMKALEKGPLPPGLLNYLHSEFLKHGRDWDGLI